ncbi:MAG: trimethylamine methyltransferase family protein [Deinococcales bacterium]
MSEVPAVRRGGRRSRNALRMNPKPLSERPVRAGLVGGDYKPLSDHEVLRIHQTALRLMEEIGLAQAIPSMVELVTAVGGWMKAGRLCFPSQLVEDIIAKARRSYIMYGQDDAHNLDIGGKRVHTGTGGAAPLVIDFESGKFRRSTALDVYDIARLVDTLDNIHFYWRSVVAGDMPDWHAVDLNTTYAALSGTTKHIGVSYADGESVYNAVDMMDMILGGEGSFRKRPVCSISCCHVVPPLRFAEDSCHALGWPACSGCQLLYYPLRKRGQPVQRR